MDIGGGLISLALDAGYDLFGSGDRPREGEKAERRRMEERMIRGGVLAMRERV